MNKLDAKHYATKEYRYWCYSPESDGMLFFRDKAERDKYAAAEIEVCCDREEGWAEWVDQICCGEVTHIATETDREDRPDDVDEEGVAGDGFYWPPDCAYRCNYELRPLPSEPFVQETQ